MTWLDPLAGVILAAALIPPLLLLYFLKLRRRSQPIACTLLWRRSVEDLQANTPFQRLRRSILLFLQLLVLALLAISIAQPRLHAGSGNAGKNVILIDNSASMTSTDVDDEGSSRLDAAKRQASDLVETRYGGGLFSSSPGQTMVVAFNDRADVMCRFTDSKQQLLAAIDRIKPSHGETAIKQAFDLSRAYTTNVNPDQVDRPLGEPATLELFSDGRINDLDDQVLRGEDLNFYAIGSEDTDNVAITSISVERPYDRPSAVQVFVALANYGPTGVTCDVELSVDGTVLSIEEVPIEGSTIDEAAGNETPVRNPGRNNVVFSPFEQPRGAVIEVANLRDDAMMADNRARLAVPPPKRLKVLLVAPRGELIQTALEGLTLQSLERVRDGEQYEEMAVAGALENYDVVVLDDYQPKAMPPGRYLVFGPPPPVEGLNPYGEGTQQIVLEWRDDHPAMRFLSLDNLYIAKFHLIEPADDVRVLAEGTTNPVLVSISRGPMQLLYCPFNPLDSNWPFHRSFVNFLLNSIEFLGHSGEGLTSKGFAPGEALTARLPSNADDITLEMPDGDTHSLKPLDPSMWSWGPASVTGAHVLTWDEGAEERGRRVFAVNLISNTEGDVSVVGKIQVGEEAVAGRSADDATYTALWPWAIGLCLGLLMLEWWVYHKKSFI